jgi:hypothetical protein
LLIGAQANKPETSHSSLLSGLTRAVAATSVRSISDEMLSIPDDQLGILEVARTILQRKRERSVLCNTSEAAGSVLEEGPRHE